MLPPDFHVVSAVFPQSNLQPNDSTVVADGRDTFGPIVTTGRMFRDPGRETWKESLE